MFAITVFDDGPDATRTDVNGTKVLIFEETDDIKSAEDIGEVNENNTITTDLGDHDETTNPIMVIDLNELVEKINMSSHLKTMLISHGILKENK